MLLRPVAVRCGTVGAVKGGRAAGGQGGQRLPHYRDARTGTG